MQIFYCEISAAAAAAARDHIMSLTIYFLDLFFVLLSFLSQTVIDLYEEDTYEQKQLEFKIKNKKKKNTNPFFFLIHSFKTSLSI